MPSLRMEGKKEREKKIYIYIYITAEGCNCLPISGRSAFLSEKKLVQVNNCTDVVSLIILLSTYGPTRNSKNTGQIKPLFPGLTSKYMLNWISIKTQSLNCNKTNVHYIESIPNDMKNKM